MKLPLAGADKTLWIIGAAVGLVAIALLAWMQVSRRAAAPVVPSCSDAAYLRDVQQILGFNGLKDVRLERELPTDSSHRRCGLLARDVSGKEVRVRGLIRLVGGDVQLSVELE